MSAALLPQMLMLIVFVFGALALAFASGCNRTVLVPEGSLLRAASDVHGHAYLWNDEAKEWRLTDEPIQYPEGWYFVPPSFVDEE